ncbi:helix-turn-helix domain-containing protein [Haoranjiania flava]|uniref:AraC family transcriptional regulator n=1 Tax=Haoranjiania flava TaxID=1856322 RepID=A0AAE3INT3_9BACT|nr:AraC family transcriptional regulator [Haoranjiania flava]MCU7695328.1 AraC family transcriptional regulator [Haoranjiania flava]
MADTDTYFTIKKPDNPLLRSIVEYYFYIDASVSEMISGAEFIIPFPRVTFGYLFDHPFRVINHTLNETVLAEIAISRISTQKITVEPSTERIKILGAHVKPFGLAHFTKVPINSLPWIINTKALFGSIANKFLRKVNACRDTESMFHEVEAVFLDNILARDLSLITKAIELIEINAAHLEITELSQLLAVSDRTIRNHFYDYIGCSPKEYLRIVKLKQIAFQMKHSESSLTHIAYDNNYFDQAHFIREVKDITGQTPNRLRKQIPSFRFLQF